MSINRMSNSLSMEDVDCWAVTIGTPSPPTIEFRWAIKIFLEALILNGSIILPDFGDKLEGIDGNENT